MNQSRLTKQSSRLRSASSQHAHRNEEVGPPAEQQLKEAKQLVVQLRTENRRLKERIEELRRAHMATTKVVKAPTPFAEQPRRKRDKEVKLPTLSPKTAKAPANHDKCQIEISALRLRIQDLTTKHAIQIDNYKSQLEDRTDALRGMGADVNRLQNLCQQYKKAQGKAPHRLPSVPAAPAADAGLVRELQARLADALSASAACAHIAQAHEQQAAGMRQTYESRLSRANTANTALKEQLRAAQDANAASDQRLKHVLKNVQQAWNEREKDFTQHIQQYKSSWEEGAKQWTEMAKEKANELKLGAEILAGATTSDS